MKKAEFEVVAGPGIRSSLSPEVNCGWRSAMFICHFGLLIDFNPIMPLDKT
jgi:hypothetical protein